MSKLAILRRMGGTLRSLFFLAAFFASPLFAQFKPNGYIEIKDKRSSVSKVFYYPDKHFLVDIWDGWLGKFNEIGERQKTFTWTQSQKGSLSDTLLLEDESILKFGSVWIDDFNRRIYLKKLTKDGTEDARFGVSGEKIISTGATYNIPIFSFELPNGNIGIVSAHDGQMALVQVTPSGEVDPKQGVRIFEGNGLKSNRGIYLGKFGIFLINSIFDGVAYSKQEIILFGLDGKRIQTFGNRGVISHTHPKGDECYRYGFEEELGTSNLIVHNECENRKKTKRYQNLYRYDENGKQVSHAVTTVVVGEFFHKVFNKGAVYFIESDHENLEILALDSSGKLMASFGNKGKLELTLPVPPGTDTASFFYLENASIDPQGRILLVYSVTVTVPAPGGVGTERRQQTLLYRLLPSGDLDR